MWGRVDPIVGAVVAPCCNRHPAECTCGRTRGLAGVVRNIFCKTGQGGGIDPTCKAGGAGGGSGSEGAGSSAQRAFAHLDGVFTRNDLKLANGGVIHPSEEFADKVVRPLHNKNQVKPLDRFARTQPEEFEKYRTAAIFKLYEDLHNLAGVAPAVSLGEFMRGEVRVYRGVSGGSSEEGRSWTIREKTAEAISRAGADIGFKFKEGAGEARVVATSIRVDDILYYSNAQDEFEVILKKK